MLRKSRSFTYNLARAATITATATANTYTVSYNSNKPSTASANISGSTANSSHTYDTAKALTANGYSLTGWSFAGWATSTSGAVVYANSASVTNLATSGTYKLYAKWTPNTNTAYKVEHYQQDVSGTGYTLKDTDNLTGTTDAPVTATAKSYAGFTENTTHASRLASGNILPNGSLVLKLYYNRTLHTVSFNSNDGSAVANITNIRYGATISAPTNPTKTGYTFGAWYKEVALTNLWVFASDTVTTNRTLYAKWTPKTYTITLSQSDATTTGTATIYEKYATGYYKESAATTKNYNKC